eukprot:TRINITY_DN55245_c0_g1_i1.p1 TRINITY_DN55245_c0_g1~~TRINITY_DN55245_c0_g1_i1.p1  ORF type:complete len:286 (+),score=55.35 TRINITY_DN55245_c0_g1_i1:17-874(+)
MERLALRMDKEGLQATSAAGAVVEGLLLKAVARSSLRLHSRALSIEAAAGAAAAAAAATASAASAPAMAEPSTGAPLAPAALAEQRPQQPPAPAPARRAESPQPPTRSPLGSSQDVTPSPPREPRASPAAPVGARRGRLVYNGCRACAPTGGYAPAAAPLSAPLLPEAAIAEGAAKCKGNAAARPDATGDSSDVDKNEQTPKMVHSIRSQVDETRRIVSSTQSEPIKDSCLRRRYSVVEANFHLDRHMPRTGGYMARHLPVASVVLGDGAGDVGLGRPDAAQLVM